MLLSAVAVAAAAVCTPTPLPFLVCYMLLALPRMLLEAATAAGVIKHACCTVLILLLSCHASSPVYAAAATPHAVALLQVRRPGS